MIKVDRKKIKCPIWEKCGAWIVQIYCDLLVIIGPKKKRWCQCKDYSDCESFNIKRGGIIEGPEEFCAL